MNRVYKAALILLLFSIAFCLAKAAKAQDNSVRLLGTCKISGTATDLSGLEQPLVPADGVEIDELPVPRTFHNNMFGGISAITWSGTKDVYWLLPDRGPLDGAVDWTCRVHQVRISIDPNGDRPGEMKLLSTVLLRDCRGIPYTGIATAFEANDTHSHRLDPEGIRVAKNGNLFVSDEYGPHLIEFTPAGDFVQEFPVPQRYQVTDLDVFWATENGKNSTGRCHNRGMEGLAISQDGQQLFGLMQSPLLQDLENETFDAKSQGLNCRLPCFDVQGKCQQEYVYHLEADNLKLNEILSCGQDRFIVIERDGESGDKSNFKKLMLVSTKAASDISAIEKLPRRALPKNISPVEKVELIDLLDSRWDLKRADFPEKIEGLAFGPDIDAEHRLLLITSDNDFNPDQDTVIYAFAISKSVLR